MVPLVPFKIIAVGIQTESLPMMIVLVKYGEKYPGIGSRSLYVAGFNYHIPPFAYERPMTSGYDLESGLLN